MPIKKIKPCAVIVAHPDDEALFFSGLILSRPKDQWHVICVTDGNADGVGASRATQFKESCRLMKVAKSEMLNFPDIFEKRLNISELTFRLQKLPPFKKVYTHGILGEYGHFHHQDVSFATHLAFKKSCPVFSTAYNIYPEEKITLTPPQYALKTKILWKVYGSETQRLINMIPASSAEGFTKVSFDEVNSIYQSLSAGKTLDEKKLKNYRWLGQWIKDGHWKLRSRPF